MREGDLDSLFIKSILDPPPQLPAYLPLFQGDGLHDHSNDDLRLLELLHAQDLHGLQDSTLVRLLPRQFLPIWREG